MGTPKPDTVGRKLSCSVSHCTCSGQAAVLARTMNLNNVQLSPQFLQNNAMEARTGKAGTGNVFMARELEGSNKTP